MNMAPRLTARIAGLFYLLTFLTGAVSSYVSGRIVVSGNAGVTASNILAHQSLFRLGFAADVGAAACYVVVTALFYDLFKPVNRIVSLLAAFFGLVGCAIQGFVCLFHLVPLVILRGGPYSSGFSAGELRTLALMLFDFYGEGFNICFVFFGVYCVLIGYLIFRSTFLPRLLGALMAIGGLGWLTFLYPPLADSLWPYSAVPGILGEGALTLWLLIFGVRQPT